jgi:hypothetical protein
MAIQKTPYTKSYASLENMMNCYTSNKGRMGFRQGIGIRAIERDGNSVALSQLLAVSNKL